MGVKTFIPKRVESGRSDVRVGYQSIQEGSFLPFWLEDLRDCLPATLATDEMSGRVGDLSNKQAETLEQVMTITTGELDID